MAQSEYTVRLEAFEGPLDLLLHLIRKAEVDVADIPVATIADQYLEHLGQIERVDVDRAGEFLVMAATLMEIKSRLLRPAPEGGARTADGSERGAEPDDPRAELVRQLLAYKMYRDVADELARRHEEWQRRFPGGRAGFDRAAAAAQGEDQIDLEDVSLIDLVEAFRRISETVVFDRLGEHEVVADDTPIELHAEDVMDRLRREPDGLELRGLFTGRTRPEAIGLFLAVLELVRRRAVSVTHDRESGGFVLRLRDGEAERV
ncbi:MAG: segregation/condensation protein A [Phycisphaerales bacterium]|nr:segregation/condensation protein A [Phycisphaerales bacterium]